MNNYKFNLFISIESLTKKKSIKILIGNNFSSKTRIIKYYNKKIIKTYKPYVHKNISSLENLIFNFYKIIISSKFKYKFEKFDISNNSFLIYEQIRFKLNLS